MEEYVESRQSKRTVSSSVQMLSPPPSANSPRIPACSTQPSTALIMGSFPTGRRALQRLSLPVKGNSLSSRTRERQFVAPESDHPRQELTLSHGLRGLLPGTRTGELLAGRTCLLEEGVRVRRLNWQAQLARLKTQGSETDEGDQVHLQVRNSSY